jgi:hypothetical protein
MLRIPTPYFDAKIWLQFSKISKNRKRIKGLGEVIKQTYYRTLSFNNILH